MNAILINETQSLAYTKGRSKSMVSQVFHKKTRDKVELKSDIKPLLRSS